jgi:hypothetical protein
VTDRIAKLIARALDPAAIEGEAINAATHALREARRRQLDVAGFAAALGIERRIEYREVQREDDPRDFVIRFGKYKGSTIGEVWHIDPKYVRWAAENLTTCDPAILGALREVAGVEMYA